MSDTSCTDYEITEIMLRYGGSFVVQLAKLYRLADSDNQKILKRSFSYYFVLYTELLEQHPALRSTL